MGVIKKKLLGLFKKKKDASGVDQGKVVFSSVDSLSLVSSDSRSDVSDASDFVYVAAPSKCLEDYECLGPVGKGATATVYSAKDLVTNRTVALKVIKKQDCLRRKVNKQSVLQEHSVMTALNSVGSPYFARLHNAFQTSNKIVLSMEFVATGDLSNYASLLPGRVFGEDVAKHITSQLCVALCTLRDQGVVYRDLKLENILIDDALQVCLADFGLARFTSEEDRCSTIAGTTRYMAPEVVKGEQYGTAVDWWSLGVLLFVMLSGSNPFPGAAPSAVMRSIAFSQPDYDAHLAHVSPACLDFLKGLLNKDPAQRLTGVSAIQHPWFAGVNWQDVRRRELKRPSGVPRPTVFQPISPVSFSDIAKKEASQDLTSEQQLQFAEFDFMGALAPELA